MGALEVAVPRELFALDRRTGAGRVWRSVLPHLEARASVRPAGRLSMRRPDVWLLPGHAEPAGRHRPVVAVIHGSAWMLDPGVLELLPAEFAAPFVAATEATLEQASLAIVPSEYTRRGLVEGGALASERVLVVPHGVDPGTFNPERRGGRRLVSAALGRDTPYVLFASIPSIGQKNLTALKHAHHRLAERGFPHALVIAGGVAGGEPDELLREIASDPPGFPGRVAWLGHLGDEELAAVMAECDAFCLPSLFEAFGLTALEAMACGAPVVASTRGALPEVVGEAALLAEPSADELAGALARVLEDGELAARLRRAGPARAARFTWRRTAEGWLGALARAAGER